tara:strand:- start:118 stop:288 length:171 start_codon:yes stop_codon:yes gene_type:complete
MSHEEEQDKGEMVSREEVLKIVASWDLSPGYINRIRELPAVNRCSCGAQKQKGVDK